MSQSKPAAAAVPPLVIAVEAWFHDRGLADQLSARHWRRLPLRLEVTVPRALAWLAGAGARVTFAVLGAVADAHPELVRAIAAAGHEVVCAGDLPVDWDRLDAAGRAACWQRWERVRRGLEALVERAVVGLRPAWLPRDLDAFAQDAAAHGFDFVAAGPACAVWQLDPEPPRLVGLPAGVWQAHAAAARAGSALLAAARARGALVPVGASRGFTAAPVPFRAPLAAPCPAARPVVAAARERLTLVVPLKDEAEGLPSLARELAALADDFAGVARLALVFVDDGSTDRTWALLQDLFAAWPDVAFVRHPHNRGVAAAIASGIRAASSDWVASIDGDLSYDPRELLAMLALREGADVVTASPYHPAGAVKNVPGWRLGLSRGLSALYRLLLRRPVHTWTACCRLYRRAAVVDLPLVHPGFLGTAELLIRVLRRGGEVREHPCVLEARLFGVSKMKVLRTIRGHLGLWFATACGRIR